MEHEALQDLLSWLLDGAMQRAPPGGRVYVSAETVEGGVAITITDMGKPHTLVSILRVTSVRSIICK